MKYRYNYDERLDDPPHFIDGFDPEDWKEMAIALIENDVNIVPDSILGQFAKSLILKKEIEVYGPIFPRCVRAIINKDDTQLKPKRLLFQFSKALIRQDSICVEDNDLRLIADAIITGNKWLLDDLGTGSI